MTAVGCTDTEQLRCSRLILMVENATYPVAAWGLQLVPIPVLHFLSAWNVPCCLDWLVLCVSLVSGRKIQNLTVKTVTFRRQRFRGTLGASSKVRTTLYVFRIDYRGERNTNIDIIWKWNSVPKHCFRRSHFLNTGWREVTVPMALIQMKQSALQYYFLRVLSKAKESCLTGEGVGGEERDDKGHLPCPPPPTSPNTRPCTPNTQVKYLWRCINFLKNLVSIPVWQV